DGCKMETPRQIPKRKWRFGAAPCSMTVSSKIQRLLKAGNDGDSSLTCDASHRIREAVAFLLHEKLANHRCRTALPCVAMNQHGRVLRNHVAKQRDCSQKLLWRIPGTIYQLNNLGSLNAQLLRFHTSDATIQTKYRSDASARERCLVLGIEVIADPDLVGNAIHGESS